MTEPDRIAAVSAMTAQITVLQAQIAALKQQRLPLLLRAPKSKATCEAISRGRKEFFAANTDAARIARAEMRERWQDKTRREEWSANIRKALAKPDVKKRHSEAMRAEQARRRQNDDDNGVKRKRMASEAMMATMRIDPLECAIFGGQKVVA